jgi:hypothetical protein
MKPHLISAHICSIALIISTWVLFVVLIINSSFAWAAVWLEAVTAPRIFMKLTRIFGNFTAEALF